MEKLIFFILIIASYSCSTYVKESSVPKSNGPKLEKNDKALNFIAMGDWGRNGADHQKQVADAMAKVADKIHPKCIIALGDNFYPKGVISKSDPLWKYSLEDIYPHFSLQCDWYPILGNHDYMANPDAQIDYTQISRRWKMPARYYSRSIPIPSTERDSVLILFIDTNPLIPQFYTNSEYGPNVRTQDSTAQKQWIEKELRSTSANIKWKIVVGHHPMFTGGSRTESYDTKAIRGTLKSLFDKYAVDAYIAGHEHSLQHIKPQGSTHHFISGAASEITPSRPIENSLFAASTYGFMLFTLTSQEMNIQTINDADDIIYKYRISKNK